MTITDWPGGDWPREKLLAKGAFVQSDVEPRADETLTQALKQVRSLDHFILASLVVRGLISRLTSVAFPIWEQLMEEFVEEHFGVPLCDGLID